MLHTVKVRRRPTSVGQAFDDFFNSSAAGGPMDLVAMRTDLLWTTADLAVRMLPAARSYIYDDIVAAMQAMGEGTHVHRAVPGALRWHKCMHALIASDARVREGSGGAASSSSFSSSSAAAAAQVDMGGRTSAEECYAQLLVDALEHVDGWLEIDIAMMLPGDCPEVAGVVRSVLSHTAARAAAKITATYRQLQVLPGRLYPPPKPLLVCRPSPDFNASFSDASQPHPSYYFSYVHMFYSAWQSPKSAMKRSKRSN
jgi:hypothetical protein